jgi:hypothetical protein
MEKPIYEGNEFEVLKVRYAEQAAHIRDLNQYEMRLFGGFISIQLLLASWFAAHPISDSWSKVGILLVDSAMLLVCLQILTAVRGRRIEIRDTIININEAFGLYVSGIYLKGKSINPQPPAKRNFIWFNVGCWVAFAGVVITLFMPLAPVTTPPSATKAPVGAIKAPPTRIGTSPRINKLALVRSFARGDLFDHLDNASPQLGVGDAGERAS